MALHDYVPSVDRQPWGITCLVLNVVVPGVGTIVGAILDDVEVRNIVFGALQLLLAFLVVGWMWSIVWGILIFTKSKPAAPTKAKSPSV